MKLATITTITFISAAVVFGPGPNVSAESACPSGYVEIESAGGPLCVGDTYVAVDSPVDFQNPAECEYGYYQGVCALPEPIAPEPVDVPVIAAVRAVQQPAATPVDSSPAVESAPTVPASLALGYLPVYWPA